jgi:SPP1 gp7 family putative phage head morphogenesis protein
MLLDVDDASLRTWRTLAETISFERRRELESTPIGVTLGALLVEQVEGITSIPRNAAERVEALALEALTSGARANELAEEISRGGEVAEADAMRLARTSVTGAATALVQARAQYAGSEGYVWETANDASVRPEHKALQGKFIRWDDPPTIGGYTAHAGQFANCFTAGTLAAPRQALSVIRARYSGELVTVRAAGAEFEATPNHPVLTPRGWVAAGLLKVGDELVAMAKDTANSVVQDVHQRQVAFGKIFEASVFAGHGATCAVEHLYGDPVEDHEVDVVSVPEHLAFERYSELFKHVRDQMVPGAYSGVGGRGIMRRCAQVLEPLGSGLSNILAALLWAETLHLQFVGGALITPEPGRSDNRIDRVRVDAGLSRNGWSPKTRFVKVENLSCRNVRSTHVFTLETMVGHYSISAAAIVVKNCRCWPRPVLQVE